MKIKIISQKMLSAECWLVQVWGSEACETCDYRGSFSCGGRNIIRKGKNNLGHDVPLPDMGSKTIMRSQHESG